nr:hypothetical protein Iba_chr11eCG9770 [Ipomoea batatas]
MAASYKPNFRIDFSKVEEFIEPSSVFLVGRISLKGNQPPLSKLHRQNTIAIINEQGFYCHHQDAGEGELAHVAAYYRRHCPRLDEEGRELRCSCCRKNRSCTGEVHGKASAAKTSRCRRKPLLYALLMSPPLPPRRTGDAQGWRIATRSPEKAEVAAALPWLP